MSTKLLFALDIGTRSVIGITAEQEGNSMKIISMERREHNTRAMLDGQIHDVPEVAAILKDVKTALERKCGPLKDAAVAAAGRALYTATADAAQKVSDILLEEDILSLDFAAVQNAQKKLAASKLVDDPTLYYCVGYSAVSYSLDGTQLKTLIGQKGREAAVTVIATFLPRQVIDSMQSALRQADLEMRSLTLEPIAAINVLIPPTMRHLNLVLVDIGAGTSDVAVTKNGSVIGYGMVPCAGDEITEAISQKYLLDFNVAEKVKRQIASTAKQRKISFRDILGTEYRLSPKEITDAVADNLHELSRMIAAQILELNAEAPQAVLLVGGGSLTPCLPALLAQALDIPAARVAVRSPDVISGIAALPNNLKTPDAVTPLGILNAASSCALNFVNATVNGAQVRLFNLSRLSVSDALLAAGIELRSIGGKPGLGITVTVNKKNQFFPGTMGKLAKLTKNGENTALSAPVADGDVICVAPGENGAEPTVYLKDIAPKLPSYDVSINREKRRVTPVLLVNGQIADPEQKLADRDEISWREVDHLGEILRNAGYIPTARKYKYTLNGQAGQVSVSPALLLNGAAASLSSKVQPNDEIGFSEPNPPQIGDIPSLPELGGAMTFQFNKRPCRIATTQYTLALNNSPADFSTRLTDDAEIFYTISEKKALIVSDVLLAAKYQPPSANSQVKFEILVNGQSAEFTTPVKSGDAVDVIITPLLR